MKGKRYREEQIIRILDRSVECLEALRLHMV